MWFRNVGNKPNTKRVSFSLITWAGGESKVLWFGIESPLFLQHGNPHSELNSNSTLTVVYGT